MKRAITAAEVPTALSRGATARVEANIPARFKPGDRVRPRNIHPTGHTRLPRYARGRLGVIARNHGVFIFPDTHAATWNQKPQHVYAVRFSAQELWGPAASPRDFIHVDLWDDYLDPA